MEWGNIVGWFQGDGRTREQEETRALWNEAQRAWLASPAGQTEYTDIIRGLVRPLWEDRKRPPASDIAIALCIAFHDLLLPERITSIEPDWPAIDGDVSIAVRFRELARTRKRWALEYERRLEIVRREFGLAATALLYALPQSCFDDDDGDALFQVPLIELVHDPAAVVGKFLWAAYDPVGMSLGLHASLRDTYQANVLVASGFSPEADPGPIEHKLVYPGAYRDQTPSALVDAYLVRTPFKSLLETSVPFHLPTEARFEHAHVIGGTGHGKTQLLQRMIHADLVAAQTEKRSIVVIDSQGDLINKLTRLALFDPDAPDSLAERLVFIDPADVEFPAALNLFDAHLDRVRDYGPADQERVLNGVIELYEVFFGAMLGAELTQKQGVIFRYLARLMLTIPGATIHTLMRLMEDGHSYKPQTAALEGSARHFFATEFFHPSFAATKKQILKRLWGVLSTPAFERMFAQRDNKLDLFEAMNAGKIILISTAKDLLKQDGSALFGRFFIAMLAQAALERSTLSREERTPTFVYVDEAQEYFDDSIETILSQARKYRVGLTLAHQTLDQLSPRLRAAIHANTSLKCAGGVSARDARALADELHTSADFIEGMRRRDDHTEFALWLKQRTAGALRMTVPLGYLERQPLMSEEAFAELLAANRQRYCGTRADVLAFANLREALPEDRRVDRPLPESAAAHAPETVPDSNQPDAPEPAGRVRSTAEPSSGKGGQQHRYVQHLIKGLAEERGFRAVIEEAVPGGQVDVGLHRGETSVACEISVTSTTAYETQNLAKCVAAGFTQVFAIATNQKRLKVIEAATIGALSEEARKRIIYLTPEDVGFALDALAAPAEQAQIVRGYKVRVSKSFVPEGEAADRRAAVARVIAQSLRGLPDKA